MLEVNFSEANLTESDFSGSSLDRSRFQQTNLSRANLAGASNLLFNPTENKVRARSSRRCCRRIVAAMGMTVPVRRCPKAHRQP